MRHRFVTGWLRPKTKKRPGYLTLMVCPESGCNHLWEASCVSRPCPKCGNHHVIAAAHWGGAGKGVLHLGKVKP